MKLLLKLEELAMLGLALYLFSFLSIQWWWMLLLFFTPDIGIIGYAINPKIGQISYNLTHNKILAIAIWLGGIYFQNEILQFIGMLLFAHASFDRILGYGLKYEDSFYNTHLGKINFNK